MHGHGAAERLRLVTAHGTIPDAVYTTQRGVFAYLTKRYDSKTLLQWIDQALRITAAAAPLPEPVGQPEELPMARRHHHP